MLRSTTVAALTIAVFASTACGDDDTPPAQPKSAGNVERYCELTREMDAAGEKFFAELERDENATPADYEAAEREFIQAHARQFDAVERLAPPTIKSDVRTLLEGQRVRAGLAPAGAVDEAEASAAEERVMAFERRSCPA
jgi:hypothetical protein